MDQIVVDNRQEPVDNAQTPAEGQNDQPTAEQDWQAKFEGQRKVNRDLERKLKDTFAERDQLKARLAELEATVAKLQGREAEYAEQLKAREVEQAALAKASERILKAEVRAAAAGKLADPNDALRFIDLSSFEVGEDGEVDATQIAQAIDDLLVAKPYLAAQGGRRFQGTADGGAREGSTKPSQLTRKDLRGMTPQEIVRAKAEGRLNDLLGRRS